jgi:hypothetical protein
MIIITLIVIYKWDSELDFIHLHINK